MRNVSDKRCRENQNTHFVFSNFFSKIVPFMRKRGKNIVERGRAQMTIWRMRIECWISKATNTHTHRVCNPHCFSTTTMVTQTRPNITLYVQCMYCLSIFLLWYLRPGEFLCYMNVEFEKNTSTLTVFVFTKKHTHIGEVFWQQKWLKKPIF